MSLVSVSPSCSALQGRPAVVDGASAWPDERVRVLTSLWLEGRSASEIARRLGGVTRNAVIGKVHRLGLSGRVTPSPPRPSATRPAVGHAGAKPTKARSRPAPVVPPPPRAPKPEGPLVSLLDLRTGRCRMPVGDPRAPGFGFCGAPAVRGCYCAAHGAVIFQPPARTASRRSRAA